jgi:glutaconate CoA-transferase subunit A
MTNDEPKSLNIPPLHLAASAAKRCARPSERRKKVISFEEVGPLMTDALQHDRTLCLGGLFKQNRPVALVRELIRCGIGELRLFSSPGSGYDVDLLVAAGLVSEAFLAAVTLENRLCPNFRSAVESGRIKAHALDALTIVGGLTAGANQLPFSPVAAWAGSDVIKHNPLAAPMTSPFDGEPLYAVRPIRPSLTLIHAQEADEYGNIRHLSSMTYADNLMARASHRVVVSVDRLVRSEVITRKPRETTIPCIYVDAVVEIPFGAHPTASFPLYSMDEGFINAFADLSDEVRIEPAKQPLLEAYLDHHARNPADVFGYIDAIGGYRRLAALEHEARFI